MRNTRRELFIFRATDINAIEEHFEGMARNGWMVDKVYDYTVKYKRAEPQELKFSVDIFNKLSTFDHPDSDVIMEYRDLCIAAGWKFLTSSNKVQIFYSHKEDNLPPVQTDERVKESIARKFLLGELIGLLICLPIFIGALKRLFPINHRRLYSNTSIIFEILAPVFILPIIVYVTSYIIWMLRAKVAIWRGKDLPKTSYRAVRFKTLLFIFTLLLLVVPLTIASIIDIFNGSFDGILRILPAILGCTIGGLYRRNIKRKKRNKSENKTAFVIIIIATFIGASILFHMLGLLTAGNTVELKEGYKGLRLTDFELPKPNYYSFTREGSIVLPKSSSYYESFNGREGNYVKTNYIEAINERVAKYMFDGILGEYNYRNKTIIPAETLYKDFDEAFFIDYLNDDKGSTYIIILLKDKEVFYIDSSFDLSDEKNIEIITNKLISE